MAFFLVRSRLETLNRLLSQLFKLAARIQAYEARMLLRYIRVLLDCYSVVVALRVRRRSYLFTAVVEILIGMAETLFK